MNTIVKAAATAAWSFEFEVRLRPKKFTGFGFSGSDAITLQEQTTDETTWGDHIDGSTGLPITLSAECTGLIIKGPGVYRWSKGVTTGSVGLRAFDQDKI